MQWHTYLLMLAMLALITLASSENIINIDPYATSGNQSLEHHLCSNSDQLQSNTVLLLPSGHYSIGRGGPCIISDINNLTIRGAATAENTVQVACTDEFFGRIFAFVNVTNLQFENFEITTCGAFIPESLGEFVNETNVVQFGDKQKAVILLIHIKNVYIHNVIMSRNFGYGIIAVNLQGDTSLDKVKVILTSYRDHPLCIGFETDLSCTGSGVFFLYTDPSPNATFSPVNSSLTITNCFFYRNSYRIPIVHYLSVYTVARSPFRTERITAIGGTGVSVVSGQRSYLLDTQVRDTIFSENEGQTSPLILFPFNNIRETSYLVQNCIFRNNYVRAPGRGGGIVFLLLVFVDALTTFPQYPDNLYTMLSVKDTEFYGNEAHIGGAIYLHMSPQNVTELQMYIYNTSFNRNIAQTGSALSANSIPTLFIPRSSEVLLEDITVTNNTFPTSLMTTTSTIDNSAALIFSLINNVTLAGRNDTGGSVLSYNSPGAVLVSGGKIYFRGHLEFSDNLSFRGGAIALFDYTLLHIFEGSRIKFMRNHALTNGGAIYANSIGTGALDVCVFQIVGSHRISTPEEVGLLDLNIKFESNYADIAGNSIYASPLYECAFSPEASTVMNQFDYNEQDLYDAVFDFIRTVPNGNEEVSSVPNRLSFCNQTIGIDYLSDLTSMLRTIPGKLFSVKLIPLDLKDTRVQSEMYAQLSNANFALGPTQNVQTHNGSNCTTVSFNIYGPESSTVQLFLYTHLGGAGLTVDVDVGYCPPGFELAVADNLLQCICSEYVMNVIQTTCNVNTYTINRPGTSWMGVANNNQSNVEWVTTCPIGYCNPDILDVDLEIPDQICDPGRTGVLCGQCQEGLSVVFGISACRECTNYWLFTIVVYAIVGILLVFALFILNFTVAKGTINGLIFYVNVVSINGGIIFESDASFVRVFVSLLNLELGFPICFYDGMTEAAKIGLQFVFPVYLLLLCLVLILLSRWSSKIQKITSCNSIAVLATLFYLSYGKLLRTVIDCFSFATLASEHGYKTIWLYDGNLQFFSGLHILLFLVACFVTLAFLIPYTLPLVFIKRVNAHTIRLKPLFDAYAGPFKDNYRHWFGFRLVILAAVCITYAITGADYQLLALTIESLLIIWFAVWQAYTQPYKNHAVGLLDLFFLLNFLTMSVWLLHLIDDVTPGAVTKRIGVVTLLVAVASAVTLGMLIYHILDQIYHVSPKARKRFDTFWQKATSVDCYQRFKQIKNMMLNNRKMTSEAYNPNNVIANSVELDTKEKSVTYSEVVVECRTQTFSQLREPVMSFSD
ncbi:uncharacterized protein LOC135346975 [Halichondria panicea]|uniref:uncharacterized protein LOC135346975 n=1 Tax=Halichondria panicea TaxID=6063 RepID=UPI00312B36E2